MRFKLAYQLAILLQKHRASKWFHKAFNSSGDPNLEDPYVVGFGSSRHRKLDAASSEGVDPDPDDYAKLYRHPGVKKGFRAAAYVVYALGCIMLELAQCN